MKNTLFYKYVAIADPKRLQKKQLEICHTLGLKGKILIAEEGINGCVSGMSKNIEKYKKTIIKDKRFSDILFKDTNTKGHSFKKIFVRIRKEIVTSQFNGDIENAAPYVEPKQLKQWLDDKEKLILVDVRNDYESKIGKFKNALTPKLKTFREWKNISKNLKNKDQKIVTYCTGGIRCEKASAFLKQQGFTNVFQLHGGILTYGKEQGNAHWQGKCFVFDERGAIDIDPKNQSEPITICIWCRAPCATYHNCVIVECDERFIACNDCVKELKGCCSKRCKNERPTVQVTI